MACQIRDEQQQRPLEERVHIGGELVMTTLTDDGMSVQPVHRFPDYDDPWQTTNNYHQTATDADPGTQSNALIVACAAARITRQEMLDRLAAIAVPAEYDPTPLGDGHLSGTRDSIRWGVGQGLLDESDWDAIHNYAKTHPNLTAVINNPDPWPEPTKPHQ